MTHFDHKTMNWIDFDEEHEDMLASCGPDVAAGLMSSDEACSQVAEHQRASRALRACPMCGVEGGLEQIAAHIDEADHGQDPYPNGF